MSKSQSSTDSKAVGIWIRVSTESQVHGDSPEVHKKRAYGYAESKGWDVVEVYELAAVSGKSVMDRPETQAMLEDVRSGRITGLIFSKLARLARNTRELLDFADIFNTHNADLISLQESIDTSSPAGRLFYTMIAAMAQWEREEISERVSAAVVIRAKMGKSTGGAAPYGYQWQEGVLMPDPIEAPIRKRLHELFVEHRRKKTVARLLNEAGYRTRKGANFSDTTVDRLLRDPTAKGWRRANYTKSLGAGKQWKLKPEDEWVWIEVEPIISEELWEQCSQILEEQRSKRKKPGRKSPSLFAGVTYCHCGKKMYVPSNAPNYTCWQCRNRIPVDTLEEVFHEQLRDFLFSPDDVANYLQKADEEITHRSALLTSLEKERKSTQQEMEKVYRLYVDDQITSEGFGRTHKPLEERLYQIEEEIPRLQGEIDARKIHLQSSDQVLSDAKDLYGQWYSLTLEERRQIVEHIVEQIVIGDDEVAIELSYLPTSQVMSTRQHNDARAAMRRASRGGACVIRGS